MLKERINNIVKEIETKNYSHLLVFSVFEDIVKCKLDVYIRCSEFNVQTLNMIPLDHIFLVTSKSIYGLMGSKQLQLWELVDELCKLINNHPILFTYFKRPLIDLVNSDKLLEDKIRILEAFKVFAKTIIESIPRR